jgi:hypothetical protein
MLQFSIEPGRLLYCVRNVILHPYASELHGFWASWERLGAQASCLPLSLRYSDQKKAGRVPGSAGILPAAFSPL